MLAKWEASDPEVRNIWNTMNQWVYQGFEQTYNNLGIDFDKNYYESDTYTLGKKVLDEGLSRGVFSGRRMALFGWISQLKDWIRNYS
jgi:arginyl-tRNA synthetase